MPHSGGTAAIMRWGAVTAVTPLPCAFLVVFQLGLAADVSPEAAVLVVMVRPHSSTQALQTASASSLVGGGACACCTWPPLPSHGLLASPCPLPLPAHCSPNFSLLHLTLLTRLQELVSVMTEELNR